MCIRDRYSIINLDQLSNITEGDEVTLENIKAAGFIKSRSPRIKILAVGELSKKVKVQAHAASKAAKAAIEKAGGELNLISISQS